jgi:uncharacterized protein YlzI (FlbEa/FlbD family)
MMRNLLRFDLAVGNTEGGTVVGINMDEISTISEDPSGSGNTRVIMSNGKEWIVVGAPEGVMDLIANITDELEGRAL